VLPTKARRQLLHLSEPALRLRAEPPHRLVGRRARATGKLRPPGSRLVPTGHGCRTRHAPGSAQRIVRTESRRRLWRGTPRRPQQLSPAAPVLARQCREIIAAATGVPETLIGHGVLRVGRDHSNAGVSGRRHRAVFQGLGMRTVLLTISEPEIANISTSGWNCHGPSLTMPSHRSVPIAPCAAAIHSTTTSTRLVGIGVPSKYFTLPSAPDSCSAVTL